MDKLTGSPGSRSQPGSALLAHSRCPIKPKITGLHVFCKIFLISLGLHMLEACSGAASLGQATRRSRSPRGTGLGDRAVPPSSLPET